MICGSHRESVASRASDMLIYNRPYIILLATGDRAYVNLHPCYYNKNSHPIRHEWVEVSSNRTFRLVKGQQTETFQKIKSVTTHSPVHNFLPVLWRMVPTLRTERRLTQSPHITIADLEKQYSSIRAWGKLHQSTDAARFQDNVQECQGSSSTSTGEQRRWDHATQQTPTLEPPKTTAR